MAWIHLHTAEALFDTMYGNVLIIKLSVILPMVILGAYHQLRLHDSLVLFARIGKGGKSQMISVIQRQILLVVAEAIHYEQIHLQNLVKLSILNHL